ncbi:MAG: YhfX family PLP-dependent enzyme [Alphaproteobacteria bacterium]|nr:YhfX family PLP-dependent enzyme [Alphaproteobacteria bacterium]
MFLEPLVRRNRALIEAAIGLHQSGALPPNAYVLDLDVMRDNARAISDEATRLGLAVFAMTKQTGRNPPAMGAVRDGGIDRFVAVDLGCARAIVHHGFRLAHLGHLVQMARCEADEAAGMEPDYWTVFNRAKAAEAATAAASRGRRQALMMRVVAPGDRFYPGHEGGVAIDELIAEARAIEALPGAHLAGVTSFPTALFDQSAGAVRPTPNLATLGRAAAQLRAAGFDNIAINAPGSTSSAMLATLAEAGATQVEPGHGLTGTTPLHAVRDELPERPAILYLSEVTHFGGGYAYCLGGGLYIDPVFEAYPVKALVGTDPDAALSRRVGTIMPAAESIDYYGRLAVDARPPIRIGDSVIFGFRPQAFHTRACLAPLSGVQSGRPTLEGLWLPDGAPAAGRLASHA